MQPWHTCSSGWVAASEPHAVDGVDWCPYSALTGHRDGQTESSAGALLQLACYAAGNATAGPQCLLAAQLCCYRAGCSKEHAAGWTGCHTLNSPAGTVSGGSAIISSCRELRRRGRRPTQRCNHGGRLMNMHGHGGAVCTEMQDSLGSSWPHAGCWRSTRGLCSTCAHLKQKAEGLAPLAVKGQAGSRHWCFYRLQLDFLPC